MANILSVFVSSACNELRDVRAAVRDVLQSLGINPQLSEDPGFPRTSGDKPYVTCLRTLADCPLVIGLLEHECGQPLGDWSPFSEYNGLRPIHAELRHALKSGKKLLLYIHQSTLRAYEQWRADPAAYAAGAGDRGPQIAMLELVLELRTHDPAPYFEKFGDSSDVVASLRKNLLNEIYASLKDQEARNRDQADYLTQQILTAAPKIRATVQEQLSRDLVAELERLRRQSEELERQLTSTEQKTRESLDALRSEKEALDGRIAQLQSEIRNKEILLTMAAVRDVRWLQFVQTTLMPKQPGRVPFHHSLEVAMRGYRTAGGRQKPELSEVTWAKVPSYENGLQRGYTAAILFKGSCFTPGITWTCRRRGEGDLSSATHPWLLPSIYFGDYLEVASGDNEPEAALSRRGYEFQVRNPEGQTSDWVAFSYTFDDSSLLEIMRESAAEGRRLAAAGDNKAAVEPLRMAMVFADRILGVDAPETAALRTEWNAALDNRTLDTLRFQIGTRVKVIAGEHAGKSGIIEKFGLRQVKPYWIASAEGDMIAAADNEVERSV